MGQLDTQKNGKPVSVSYTDGDTLRDVADLYAMLDSEYNGTPSAQSEQLKSMLQDLQAGRTLSDGDWALLTPITAQHGADLAKWRQTPEGKREGFVPVDNNMSTARIHESISLLPRSMREAMGVREAGAPPKGDPDALRKWYNDGADGQINWGSPGDFDDCVAIASKYVDNAQGFCNERHQDATGAAPGHAPGEEKAKESARSREDSGKFLAAVNPVYDPKLVGGDPAHAQEAATMLEHAGRVRVSGGGPQAAAAVDDIVRRVGSLPTSVAEMAVNGTPYQQIRRVAEAEIPPGKPKINDKEAQGGALPASRIPGGAVAESPQTVCVDFDGVLHMGPHGLPGAPGGDISDGAIDALKQIAQNYRVVILTARNDTDAVKAWLKEQGAAQFIDAVTNVKPSAAAYIDDRAVPFDGDWKNALAAVDPEQVATPVLAMKPLPTVKESTVVRFHIRESDGGKGAPSTTKLDKQLSAAHLHDSVLHDLAHTVQHLKRLAAPDVKADEQSEQFNYEHALKHAESAQDHANRLGQNLSGDASDPKVFASEREKLNAMREAARFLPPSFLG